MANDNKLVNLADLKAAFDEVNDKAGVTSVNSQTGAVSITPANIGAHPAHSNLQVTSNSSYTGTPANAIAQPVAQILDSSGFIRHQMFGIYNTDESFYVYITTRRPSGSSVDTNNIAIGFDANGDGMYKVSHPEAFRSAIGATNTKVKGVAESSYRTGNVELTPASLGLGNVNNSLVLTAATGTALYTQLNALPISPTNGAGVTCYINNGALNLLTGKTGISGVLHGVITRVSTTRFRVFGMYGDTGYIMYWVFDITSAGAITPMTVYKLQGTTM